MSLHVSIGHDPALFVDNVPPELICAICFSVLDNPVSVFPCEHVYCSSCLHESMRVKSACPQDRLAVTVASIFRAPRLYRQLLDRLRLNCEFECGAVVSLGLLDEHRGACPRAPVTCGQCRAKMPRCEQAAHTAAHEAEPVQCTTCGEHISRGKLADHDAAHAAAQPPTPVFVPAGPPPPPAPPLPAWCLHFGAARDIAYVAGAARRPAVPAPLPMPAADQRADRVYALWRVDPVPRPAPPPPPAPPVHVRPMDLLMEEIRAAGVARAAARAEEERLAAEEAARQALAARA